MKKAVAKLPKKALTTCTATRPEMIRKSSRKPGPALSPGAIISESNAGTKVVANGDDPEGLL
ncbi:hypothetical protein HPP92_015118 [Vanilla planifolia]|uniref:Uncharacterized protein n=1 Tax=Vanilla planifolia TaxID=51239 RepID=A0A835UVH8_VANPL|nr:hypothetical protein HPP92_015118 [Vanilla planifolia]